MFDVIRSSVQRRRDVAPRVRFWCCNSATERTEALLPILYEKPFYISHERGICFVLLLYPFSRFRVMTAERHHFSQNVVDNHRTSLPYTQTTSPDSTDTLATIS
jgi:hypothetical protein